MGLYQYVRKAWKVPSEQLKELNHERLIQWRKQPVTVRLERPTRIDRARSLGYKAKQGFIIVRQRVLRGGRQRPKIVSGRRPKHYGRRIDPDISYQQIAEQRAIKKYKNCEVLNSYWVGQDGLFFWYEVILVDIAHPVIKADPRINWILNQHGRVFRGLTSAGKKSRGLRWSGKGSEHTRPSKSADYRTKVRKQYRR